MNQKTHELGRNLFVLKKRIKLLLEQLPKVIIFVIKAKEIDNTHNLLCIKHIYELKSSWLNIRMHIFR